jgi:hypothetical protein
MNKFFFDQGFVQVTDSRVVLGRQVIVLEHVCALQTQEKKNVKLLSWSSFFLALVCFVLGLMVALGTALIGDSFLGSLPSEETQATLFVLAVVLSLVALFLAFTPAQFTFKIILQLSNGQQAVFTSEDRVLFNNVYRAINDALAFRSLKSF